MAKKSPLWRGVFVLGSGTALAQVIGVISTPILTRLYSPFDFGILGLYSSLLAILVSIASFRYEMAIPIPKESHRAAHILAVCMVIILGVTGLMSILFFLIGNIVIDLLGITNLQPYMWLVVIGFFGSSVYQALNFWAIRQQDYSRITKTKINQGLGGALSKILFGFLSVGAIGLIIGYIVTNVAGIYTFIKAIIKQDRKDFTGLSKKEMLCVVKEYRSFPLFSAPSSLLVAVSLQLPVIALSAMYGLEVVGWYTLAYQILALPISLVSGSMSLAFYGEAAKSARENPETLERLYMDTAKKLALIGVPLIGSFSLIAPLIFPIVFGGAWGHAGLYCIPLTLVAISQFIFTPISKLAIYGFNHWDLYFNLARLATILSGFYLSYLFNFEPIAALAIYAIIMAVMHLVLFLMNLHAIKRLNRGLKTKLAS